MAIFTIHHPLSFTFGLLGNIISFLVYLAPLQTFYRIYRKKSTEGFQSIPYVVALFSSMLWMFYGFLKPDAKLLITINSFGCVIETLYIAVYITYAASKARVQTAKLLVFFNLGGFSLILLLTLMLAKGPNRVHVLGWVCVAFSTSVFAAPLSIMRLVIRTKSVEFMPFSLSFFLMLSAVMWFSYGFLLKDIYIALPNILGFIFGVLQMVLYAIYRNKGKVNEKVVEEEKLPQEAFDAIKLEALKNLEEIVIEVQSMQQENNTERVEKRVDEQMERTPPYEIKTNEFEVQVPAIAVV